MGVTRTAGLPAWLTRLPVPAMAAASYPGFVNWITDQPGWEIGLAPLTDNPFNRCKSPIKTLDYAALGMAVLASDVPAYRGSLADGPGGMLVGADQVAWYAAIARLLRNPTVRHGLAEGARRQFLAAGTLAAQDAARRAAWLELAPGGEAIPGQKVVPGHGAVPGGEAAPGREVVLGNEAVSGNEVVSGSEAVPDGKAVPGAKAVAGSEAVPATARPRPARQARLRASA
jgi:Glycosyl transferases group 1